MINCNNNDNLSGFCERISGRLVLIGVFVLSHVCLCQAQSVIRVFPDRITGHVDERLYSQFLEHIYHSVHGGLWGEMLWNRSFEENKVSGLQFFKDHIEIDPQDSDNEYLFGDKQWKDYEYTVQAMCLEESLKCRVIFRAQSDVQKISLNLGGKRNTIQFFDNKTEKRGLVQEQFSGNFEPGHWYTIKIRCEGAGVQGWIDGELVFNIKNEDVSAQSGCVGIGVLDSQILFRHIQVKSLDGIALLGPDAGLTHKPRYWDQVGTAEVQSLTGQALNSDVYMVVEGQGGLCQKSLNVDNKETYHGSLWVRGDVPGGIVVRLKEGPYVLAEKVLMGIGSEWREKTFQFQPSRSATNATFEIVLVNGGTLEVDQVSLMSASSLRVHGFHPNLLRLLAELKPKVLRWPGGVFVNTYQWKDAIGPQYLRRVNRHMSWDDRDINCVGIDEFITLCRLIKAEPSIVLNIGIPGSSSHVQTDQYLQDAIDFVQYCNGPNDSKWGSLRSQYGHDKPYRVQYWELGDTADRSNAETYIQIVKQWSDALKLEDSSIQILASGNGSKGTQLNSVTMDLISQCQGGLDLLTIERYIEEGNPDADLVEMQLFLASLETSIRTCANPDLKVAITEWAMRSPTWNAGVYAGAFQNLLEQHSDLIVMASPAILLRHLSGTGNDYGLINFNSTGWFAGPVYRTMKLWRDFYSPFRIELQGGQSLFAVATVSEDKQHTYLKLVNTNTEAQFVNVQIDGVRAVQQASLWSIAANLYTNNSMQSPHVITPAFRQVNAQGRYVSFNIPSTSVAVLDCKLAESVTTP